MVVHGDGKMKLTAGHDVAARAERTEQGHRAMCRAQDCSADPSRWEIGQQHLCLLGDVVVHFSRAPAEDFAGLH